MDETSDYKKWGPSTPKAVFLLVHGLGAHAGRWEVMGDFFAKKGIASYAVELKNLNQPYNKFVDLYNLIVQENPSKKIFLVGESMGSIISLLLLSDSPGIFSGLICISPAFMNRYRLGILDFIKMFPRLFYSPKKVFKLAGADVKYGRGERPDEVDVVTDEEECPLVLAERPDQGIDARHIEVRRRLVQ